jgi:hypothetical protein
MAAMDELGFGGCLGGPPSAIKEVRGAVWQGGWGQRGGLPVKDEEGRRRLEGSLRSWGGGGQRVGLDGNVKEEHDGVTPSPPFENLFAIVKLAV